MGCDCEIKLTDPRMSSGKAACATGVTGHKTNMSECLYQTHTVLAVGCEQSSITKSDLLQPLNP